VTTPPKVKIKVSGRTRDVVIALDRGIFFFAQHWLAFFNLFIFVFVGLPFLAPVLMKAGATLPAGLIYRMYGPPFCHQLGYRSWFLFGERAYYPRDQGVFEAYTGIDVSVNTAQSLLAARDYIGNEQMGYKVAYCQRDIAIYGFILIGGLVYSLPFVRRRLKPLHWLGWVLLGIVPIGLDGFTQLFSQALPLGDWLPPRESGPFLRTLTGGLFGLANMWLAYPYFEESMKEVMRDLSEKLTKVDAPSAPPNLTPNE
jgi:uncharacterized membrane protein